MATEVMRETWESFWGELLFLRFHEGDPERWTKRQQRATRLVHALGLRPGARVLDLGCGDGILDICLARQGMRVIAVDRIGPVLEAARREPDGNRVRFIHDDVRRLSWAPASFDAVLILEMVGLMECRDDAALIESAARWLTPGGRLMVDCPADRAEGETCLTREFDDGVCEVRADYDPATRLQRIVPVFRRVDGQVIELLDPYAPEGRDGCGVLRYVYPKSELAAMLSESGLDVREAEHHWGEGHYLLIGEHPVDDEALPEDDA